jgi:hypothetical protein
MSNVNIIFVLTSESELRWLLAPTEEREKTKTKELELKMIDNNGKTKMKEL